MAEQTIARILTHLIVLRRQGAQISLTIANGIILLSTACANRHTDRYAGLDLSTNSVLLQRLSSRSRLNLSEASHGCSSYSGADSVVQARACGSLYDMV